MIYEEFITPLEVASQIASSAREKRLLANLSQKSLSHLSGVSLGVLKKFERTGKISLESLLKLAAALGTLKNFIPLFKDKTSDLPATLDELLKTVNRKRGKR